MLRQEDAKKINWNGTAMRLIKTNEFPRYTIGQIVNPGLCWSDGGEFRVETSGKYNTIFKIIENVDGHQVDYENEEECFNLGCEDCNNEKEILIDRNFEVVDFWEWNEETKHAECFIKAI